MPYNPGVQDVTGQIYAQGGSDAARIRFQGDQAIAQGISSAGGAIAGGMVKLGDTLQQKQGNQATAEWLTKYHPELFSQSQDPGQQQSATADWLTKFHKTSLSGQNSMLGTVASGLFSRIAAQNANTQATQAATQAVNTSNTAQANLGGVLGGVSALRGSGGLQQGAVITAPSGAKYQWNGTGWAPAQ